MQGEAHLQVTCIMAVTGFLLSTLAVLLGSSCSLGVKESCCVHDWIGLWRRFLRFVFYRVRQCDNATTAVELIFYVGKVAAPAFGQKNIFFSVWLIAISLLMGVWLGNSPTDVVFIGVQVGKGLLPLSALSEGFMPRYAFDFGC